MHPVPLCFILLMHHSLTQVAMLELWSLDYFGFQVLGFTVDHYFVHSRWTMCTTVRLHSSAHQATKEDQKGTYIPGGMCAMLRTQTPQPRRCAPGRSVCLPPRTRPLEQDQEERLMQLLPAITQGCATQMFGMLRCLPYQYPSHTLCETEVRRGTSVDPGYSPPCLQGNYATL